MFQNWINFYTVSTLVLSVILVYLLYKAYRLLEYQNAAMPWPPGIANCPDGWKMDSEGWCTIPSKNAPSECTGTFSRETTGSSPSVQTTAKVCATNVGTIHTKNTTNYDSLVQLVGAVHKPASAGTGFVTTGIVAADYIAGKVSIDFKSTTPERRIEFCNTYGVFWDGLTMRVDLSTFGK